MSRKCGELYFAPGVKFKNLDLKGKALPRQFGSRIAGYYLQPALLLSVECAFAAGALVVCAMDAMTIYIHGTSSGRVETLCRSIPDLASDANAAMFVECFRNGLVHQAWVKNGCEFDSGINRVAVRTNGRLIVNPKLLANAVLSLLDGYVISVEQDPTKKAALVKKLRGLFHYELKNL